MAFLWLLLLPSPLLYFCGRWLGVSSKLTLPKTHPRPREGSGMAVISPLKIRLTSLVILSLLSFFILSSMGPSASQSSRICPLPDSSSECALTIGLTFEQYLPSDELEESFGDFEAVFNMLTVEWPDGLLGGSAIKGGVIGNSVGASHSACDVC